jgi:hypothetical protein
MSDNKYYVKLDWGQPINSTALLAFPVDPTP